MGEAEKQWRNEGLKIMSRNAHYMYIVSHAP